MIADKKVAILSRWIVKNGPEGQRVLAVVDADQEDADEAIDIARKKRKKYGHNHEDEEHDKYDVESTDELADDYNEHGGKDAEEVEREKEGGKKEPKDGKTPADDKATVPPAAIKPAPIVPVQQLSEFLTKCNTPAKSPLPL